MTRAEPGRCADCGAPFPRVDVDDDICANCITAVVNARLLAKIDRLRTSIAQRIRAELVCCDVYERDHYTDRAGRTHPICFWGEAAARIAEEADLDTGSNPGVAS